MPVSESRKNLGNPSLPMQAQLTKPAGGPGCTLWRHHGDWGVRGEYPAP
jgi:hypothetical protein